MSNDGSKTSDFDGQGIKSQLGKGLEDVQGQPAGAGQSALDDSVRYSGQTSGRTSAGTGTGSSVGDPAIAGSTNIAPLNPNDKMADVDASKLDSSDLKPGMSLGEALGAARQLYGQLTGNKEIQEEGRKQRDGVS